MANKLSELVPELKRELTERSSLELMFEHIASVHHYIYYGWNKTVQWQNTRTMRLLLKVNYCISRP